VLEDASVALNPNQANYITPCMESIKGVSRKGKKKNKTIFLDSLSLSVRHTTRGRTPLDEWSARRRDLYLTTNNTHKKQTSMFQAGLEPTIPGSERPQTHALDRAANGID
jgi:hypothetical protein